MLPTVVALPADGESWPAVLAACAARRWLARNASGVTDIRSPHSSVSPAIISLVACLPALERVKLDLPGALASDNLNRLLEALAWCPRLRALDVCVRGTDEDEGESSSDDEEWKRGDAADRLKLSPDARALAKLPNLTRLALCFHGCRVHYSIIAGVASSLVLLTGLAELSVGLPTYFIPTQTQRELLCEYGRVVVPAALGQLKGLRSLEITNFKPCDLEAGCFDLPKLRSLAFRGCRIQGRKRIQGAEVLPGVTALQSLTRIEFSGGEGPSFFDPQLVQLPLLQHMVFQSGPNIWYLPAVLSSPPADMGSLSCSLLHLDFRGHRLRNFPLILTQLVALKCLNASENEFAELPAVITALSRLTELWLGGTMPRIDRHAHQAHAQLHGKCSLDARAPGDLSGFPALCELTFDHCEVVLCESMQGAVRHASLASLIFCVAHPAPECAAMVLQLSQALRRLRRGRVLRFVNVKREDMFCEYNQVLEDPRMPFHKFQGSVGGMRAVRCSFAGHAPWGRAE